jgi:ABC-type polysaccharide/polyol phosphate export permease
VQAVAGRYANLLREFTICGFKLRDQGSLLGFVWTLLHPLLLLLVLSLLFSRRLSEDIPHPTLYLLIGIVHWSYFSTATTKTVNSITSRDGLVRNVPFPREILVFADVGSVLLSFVLEIGVLILFVLGSGVPIRWSWLFLPVVIALQTLVVTSIGLFLACARVFVRDIERVWTIVLRIGFFCVPIFYTTAILTSDLQRILFACNPLARLMAFSRSILIDGTLPSAAWIGYVLAFGALALVAALWFFKRFERRFPERL